MGMSRLRKANWLPQGFTAKEWLNLKDDPKSPASQAGVHPRDDLPLQNAGPCPPRPSWLLTCSSEPPPPPPRPWLSGPAACPLGSACSWRAVSRQLWAGLICMVFRKLLASFPPHVFFFPSDDFGQPESSGFILLLWVTLAFSLKGLKSTVHCWRLCRPVFCTSLVCCHHVWPHRLGWHTTLEVVEGQAGCFFEVTSALWPR